MSGLSRRRFLKISAATIAAAGSATIIAQRALAASRTAAKKGIQKVATFCDVCFWKCGAVATLKDGELWKIEGNPKDPLCRGRLCPRGTGGIGAHGDPDRLKTPLIRTHERGEEQWKAVTWDEALDYIAQRMLKIKAEHGPESMALFSHGIGGTFFKHAWKAFGSPNISAPSFAQCRGPRDVGFKLTFGDDVGSPERTDIANARCLVLIGSHLGENMHNTQVQEFAEAVGKGASVIVVDPRFSVAAGKAKHYLPIKPGTDMALILAWMHVIVTEKIYDKEYVAAYGFGFDAFAASLAEYTPEWAYPETGITPEVIRETAREMARYKPATLVHPGRHVNWNGDDAQRSRAIALLNALLGSWGRKGGFYQQVSMDVPKYPYPKYPEFKRPKADNPDHKHPFAHETLTTGVREATLTGKPYPIKGWFVYATNLLHALPDQAATIEAIKKLDLLVVVDVIPSEIAGWADVVLPESIYLERHDDLNVEWFREPFVALRQPVLESPHDQKPNWWIARKLAAKLGLESFFPWKTIEEYLEHRATAAGLDWEKLQRDGIIHGAPQPIYYEDGVPAEFYTPTGKIEFYSNQLKEAGFDPVPRYTPPDPGPPGAFRLLFGRAPVHSFSRTHTNPILADAMDENEVWVNNVVARRMGLKSGEYIKLKNQDGVVSNRVRVKATMRIRQDCVYLVHGFGHSARGMRRAFGKGASDAGLVTRYKTDPLMGGTGMNMNYVSLEVED
jgi:thiosulfate reductase/polysulfide reductase chain A